MSTSDQDSSHALFIFAAVTVCAVLSLASFHYFKQNRNNLVTLHVCTTCSLTKRDATLTKADGSKLESGKQMLTSILNAFDNHPNWIKVSDAGFRHKLSKRDIQINPVQCFSACSNACSVIFSAPNKYQYHFARFNPDDVKDIEDVVTFGEQYVQSNDECHTKAADRPERLQKANTISRVPPVSCCRAGCKGTQ
jgi:predicted metal-binding protein